MLRGNLQNAALPFQLGFAINAQTEMPNPPQCMGVFFIKNIIVLK